MIKKVKLAKESEKLDLKECHGCVNISGGANIHSTDIIDIANDYKIQRLSYPDFKLITSFPVNCTFQMVSNGKFVLVSNPHLSIYRSNGIPLIESSCVDVEARFSDGSWCANCRHLYCSNLYIAVLTDKYTVTVLPTSQFDSLEKSMVNEDLKLLKIESPLKKDTPNDDDTDDEAPHDQTSPQAKEKFTDICLLEAELAILHNNGRISLINLKDKRYRIEHGEKKRNIELNTHSTKQLPIIEGIAEENIHKTIYTAVVMSSNFIMSAYHSKVDQMTVGFVLYSKKLLNPTKISTYDLSKQPIRIPQDGTNSSIDSIHHMKIVTAPRNGMEFVVAASVLRVIFLIAVRGSSEMSIIDSLYVSNWAHDSLTFYKNKDIIIGTYGGIYKIEIQW